MSSALGNRAEGLSGPRRALLERLLAERSAAAAPREGRAMVRLRASERGPQVILVHPSGGELFCYTPLVRALRQGLGAAGFAADPRDAAVPAADGMTAAAARIARALSSGPDPVTEPYCLAGWSYGGVLAFETARQLERDTGARPPVVLLDADYDEDLGPLDESTIRRRFVHDVARLAGHDGPAVCAVLEDPAHGRADLGRTLASLGVEPGLSAEELAERYAVFRGCALALNAYSPQGPYTGPVTLLAVRPRGAVEERWRAVCSGRFRAEDLPGDHYTVFTAPALGRIVAEIERTLAP